MPSSLRPLAHPNSGDSESPVVDWNAGIGSEPETVLKAPRGDFVPAETAGAAPSFWRRLFPPADESPETQPAFDAVQGISLGHFTIQRRIGSGAMGAVFLAFDERLKRRVALKVLAPFQAADLNTVHRFQNEAQAAARLDHDHIARVYYYGEEHGLHFIASEFVDGLNLRDLLRQRGRITPPEAVNFAIQIATALRHTSRHGVVHRDIKPSNIIVTTNGRTKLVDLGLAKQDGSDSGEQLTVAGTTLGTFDYISPEQARDPRSVDVRSDLYSLGCTLYHLLAGVPPYPEGTVLQKLLDHQAQETPDVCAKNRRVPPALSTIIKKMMASEPKARYQSPDELLVDLAVIARNLGLRVMASDAAAVVAESRLRGSWWDRNFGWVMAAAALLLVVTGLKVVPDIIDQNEDWSAGIPRLPTISSPPKLQVTPSSPPESLTRSDTRLPATSEPPNNNLAETPSPQNSDGPLVKAQPAQTDRPKPDDEQPAEPKTVAKEATQPPATSPPAADITKSVDVAKSPDTAKIKEQEKLPAISIVDSSSKAGFSKLEEACREAKEGDIIELRYNGARAPIDQSLRLTNKQLTIRGAQGYRPQLHFTDTGRTSTTDQSNVSQITVAGGSLRLVNLDVIAQLNHSSTVAGWSLIALERPESLRLDGVSITILNPKRLNATVIEHGTAASAGTGMTKTGLPVNLPEIQLSRCVIRGAANLLTVRDPTPGRCLVQDSLIALEDSFLQLLSHSSMAMADFSPLQLELQHTTSILNGSLIVSRAEENLGNTPLPLRVRAQNNLISVGKDLPLVNLSLNDAMDTRESLVWSGERNHYNDVKTFWLIRSQQNLNPMDFSAWKEFWGSDSSGSANLSVRWAGAVRQLAMQDLALDDVGLTDSGGPNPAMNAATDGTDLGAPLADLPEPPKIVGDK